MSVPDTIAPISASAVNKEDKRNTYSGAILGGRLVPTGEVNPKTVTPSTRVWPEPRQSADKAALQRAADRVNQAPVMVQRRLRFRVHEETGEVILDVMNADTGKVLSTIPPEALLDLEARLRTMSEDSPSLLIDKNA